MNSEINANKLASESSLPNISENFQKDRFKFKSRIDRKTKELNKTKNRIINNVLSELKARGSIQINQEELKVSGF